MAALLFSLIAVALLGLGARDQLTLAAMAARQGPRPALLIVAMLSGIATVALAVWGSTLLVGIMPEPARRVFLAMALGLAGAEMLVWRRASRPLEPTNSLGAFALVLLAQQLTDATRFVTLGLAVATGAPLLVGMGAGAAAIGLAAAGWLLADAFVTKDWLWPRRLMGIAALALAAILAAQGMGRL